MSSFQAFGGGSSGSSAVTIDGDGPLYGKAGVIWAQPHIAVAPLRVENQDGIDGAPRWSVQPGYLRLGVLRGADGTITTDQIIELAGAEQYEIDRIVFCHATAVPIAMQGGIYTLPSKAGDAIVAASQLYTGLGDDLMEYLVVTPTAAMRSVPYLYLSLTTPNVADVTFDVMVFGRVIEGLLG